MSFASRRSKAAKRAFFALISRENSRTTGKGVAKKVKHHRRDRILRDPPSSSVLARPPRRASRPCPPHPPSRPPCPLRKVPAASCSDRWAGGGRPLPACTFSTLRRTAPSWSDPVQRSSGREKESQLFILVARGRKRLGGRGTYDELCVCQTAQVVGQVVRLKASGDERSTGVLSSPTRGESITNGHQSCSIDLRTGQRTGKGDAQGVVRPARSIDAPGRTDVVHLA